MKPLGAKWLMEVVSQQESHKDTVANLLELTCLLSWVINNNV